MQTVILLALALALVATASTTDVNQGNNWANNPKGNRGDRGDQNNNAGNRGNGNRGNGNIRGDFGRDETTEVDEDITCGENQVAKLKKGQTVCKCAQGFRKAMDGSREADALVCTAKTNTFCKSGRPFSLACAGAETATCCSGCKNANHVWTKIGVGPDAKGKCRTSDWRPRCKNNKAYARQATDNCACREPDQTWAVHPDETKRAQGKGKCVVE